MTISITPEDKHLYWEKGFLVFETGIPDEVLTGAIQDLSRHWTQKEVPDVAYADNTRIQDAWSISDNVLTIAQYPTVLNALESLYECKPLPFQTLNFPAGTEQKAHSDSIHFNSEPFGFMCGVWVALEDIGPKQGPLVYYPGSHKLPEMNFQDLGIEPSYDNYPEYEAVIERLIAEKGFSPEYGTIKKGQAVIWTANILHGGSRQIDKSLSRHSQVTHYFFENCRYWRPGYRANGSHYFEPHWVGTRKYKKSKSWLSKLWRKVKTYKRK